MNKLWAWFRRWRPQPRRESLTSEAVKRDVEEQVENYRRRIKALEIQAQVQRGKR